MKVFLTVWILAVLIQEVIPSTLVRLPRHADKNLSLVHTEYEAKYEQKGKHGNESYSSVSGKQQIVHDNCAQDWNSFAEKCASLIKDLVASLANAVSSTPGDATNLQLHIKNTFKHFDNTHNCTCLNHTEKPIPDLNLSPLFKNITINTVGPGTKTDAESDSGAKKSSMKCGGKNQPCDGGSGSHTKEDKNTMPESNATGGDKNDFDQKQLQENDHPADELCDGQDDQPHVGNFVKNKTFDDELAEEPKQQNRSLYDSENLDMNPENAEVSNLQSTNNNRRQVKDPQKISKNSGESGFNLPAGNLKPSSSNSKHPEGVRYPFLVTARPNFQSNEPFESSAAALNPSSLSAPSPDNDLPNSSEHQPSHHLLSQEHPSMSAAIPPHSSSINSNGTPSSASHLLTSPNNGNSSPSNNYMPYAPQAVTEPHSSFRNEEDPKKGFSLNSPGSHQKSTMLPINPVINKNNQSPVIISEEPFTKNYNSEPKVLVPAKSESNEPSVISPVVLPEDQPIYNAKSETEALAETTGSDLNTNLKQLFPEKPMTNSQASNPALIPMEQLENDHKLMPLVTQPEKPISTSLIDSSNADAALPVQLGSKSNSSSSITLPEESLADSRVLKPGFNLAEQVEIGSDAVSSPITKSSQQPNTEDFISNSSLIISDNYKSNINFAATPAVPVESVQSVVFPGELGLPKTIKPESSGSIPETTDNHYDSESLLFTENKKPVEEISKEWLPFTTPKTYESVKTSKQGSTKPSFTMTMSEEDQEALKKLPSAIPVIKSSKNFPQSSKPESDVVTLNPSPIYKPSSTDSSLNTLPDSFTSGKYSPILSPEDILPIAANGKPFFEESTAAEYDKTTADNLIHTISTIKPPSIVPDVVSQQSEASTPIEKRLHDKSNQVIVPESHITGLPTPIDPKSPIPQKPLFNTQNSDTETVSSSIENIQHPHQSIQEIFTTPLPFHAAHKPVTVIPAIGQQSNLQPEVAEEDSENYESHGKDFTVTELPIAFSTPGASISEDQKKQPSITGVIPQSGERVKTSVIAPEIAATTPVIVYPLKPFPISSQSPEHSHQGSSHSVLANDGFSDGKEQGFLFTTQVPLPPIKGIQVQPAEQQNINAGNSIQPTATIESCSTSDSPNKQEHPLTDAASNVHYPQVIEKPDKNSDQLTPSNLDHKIDHPQSGTDLNSDPSSTGNQESQPETSVPPTDLKTAQPGALIQNSGAHPHQEREQNPLLIQPTTFQTTSEDPTPSQVKIPGLLAHTTSIPLDSDETVPVKPSTSPKTTSIYEHDDDDEEDCCSCESCTEEEITDPKQYKETACKDLEEARKELKAIFDKIKKKLKCGRKAPQTITSS